MFVTTGCPKNGVLTVHYGVEEITVNVRKMLKKFYWTYLLIWRFLKVALNRSIILKYRVSQNWLPREKRDLRANILTCILKKKNPISNDNREKTF
jgi:hypothetical protein